MTTPDTRAVAAGGWTAAFSEKTEDSFDDAFADDIVLEAAVLYEPVVGRDQVRAVMAAASNIYESLSFITRTVADHETFLTWHATAFNDVHMDGVTVLTSNDAGQIVQAAIHHRPLGVALQFSGELRRRLDGVIPNHHFYPAY